MQRGRSRGRPDSGGTDCGPAPTVDAAPSARGAGRRDRWFSLALGLIGLNVENRLDPTTLDIPGTSSSRANALVAKHFGDSAPFVILLRGPAAALDRQGPELIRAMRRDPKVTTLSPWDRGNVSQLRPDPAPGADPGRLPRRRQNGRQRNRGAGRSGHRRTDPRSRPGHADRLRDDLAGDPGRIDRLQRAGASCSPCRSCCSFCCSSSARRSPPRSRSASARSLSSPRAGSSTSSPPGSASMPSR